MDYADHLEVQNNTENLPEGERVIISDVADGKIQRHEYEERRGLCE